MNDFANPRIGFIGLGIMGRPMAGHVLAAGYQLTVWNRTADKADELVARAARRAGDPAEVAKHSDIVATIVTDAPDVEAVLFGERGVVGAWRAGPRPSPVATPHTVIDLSTIAPGAARRIAGRLADLGIDFLDAPVTGGQIGAPNAALTIMAGGDDAVFERCRPLLETMGKRIHHVGPVGTGQLVKACNQILCAVNMIGVCEAIALARACGIDPAAMIDVTATGAGGSWALDHLGRKIVAGDLKPAFTLALMQKDLRAVMQTAAAAGVELPGAALAMELFAAAESRGGPDQGTQAMIRAYDAKAK